MKLPVERDIHRMIVHLADAGQAFALATILEDSGSTPRKAGTQALIDASGAIRGTVGGGQVEGETQRRAVEAIRSGRPVVLEFALGGASAKGARPICGGSMRILIDPTVAEHRAAYGQAAEARRRRQLGAIVTAVSATPLPQVQVRWFAQEAVAADAPFPGAEAIRSVMTDQAPRLFVQESAAEGGARLEALVEPVAPPPLLVIAGGGHVGQALALQAALVGFDVLVVDDRKEFTDPVLYPEGVTTRCGDIAQGLADLPMGEDVYIALVTRGHESDRKALAACIHKPAAYLGMIGSRRKVAMICGELADTGIASQEELRRIHAPIGLDIGAQTVPEIATSIVAQLVAVRRKGSAVVPGA